jgi:hypothetical protein
MTPLTRNGPQPQAVVAYESLATASKQPVTGFRSAGRAADRTEARPDTRNVTGQSCWRTSRSDHITPVAPVQPAHLDGVLAAPDGRSHRYASSKWSTPTIWSGNTARSDKPIKDVFTASTTPGCETRVQRSADAYALSRPMTRRSEHIRAELARRFTRSPRVAEADPDRDTVNTSHIPPTEARLDAAEEQARPADPRAFPRRSCRQASSKRLGREPPCTATSAAHVDDATAFTVRRRKRHRSSAALLQAPDDSAADSANRSSAEQALGPAGGGARYHR